MSRIRNIILGIVILVFGIILYPHYINYVWTPIVDFVDPAADSWLEAGMQLGPFVALLGIVFVGVMRILNKTMGERTG